MSRSPAWRLEDILLACDVIDAHLRRGPAGDPLADGLVFDAVRVRLIEIGEAAKDLPADLTAIPVTCRFVVAAQASQACACS